MEADGRSLGKRSVHRYCTEKIVAAVLRLHRRGYLPPIAQMRRSGIGRALMATAEQYARENGGAGHGLRQTILIWFPLCVLLRRALCAGAKHVSIISGNPESSKFYVRHAAVALAGLHVHTQVRIGYRAEDLGRARQVVFGSSNLPRALLARLKDAILQSRIAVPTIMSKPLA